MFNLRVSNVVGFHYNEIAGFFSKVGTRDYMLWGATEVKLIRGALTNPENKNDFMEFGFVMFKQNKDTDYTCGFILSDTRDFEWFWKLENDREQLSIDCKDIGIPRYVKIAAESNAFYRSSLGLRNQVESTLAEVLPLYEFDIEDVPQKQTAMKILQHPW